MKSNLTLVTSLFDIKRGDLDGFGRAFSHYVETFERLLQTELPMVIFCDGDVEEIVWRNRKPENTQVVRKTLDDLRNFPFYEQTNKIRVTEEWRGRAGWLPDSPQSQLELYNPLVMSKQFFLNDAAIFNFFDTKYFAWIDAGIANTIGDPCEYFNLEMSRKITKRMNKMTYLAYPYDGQAEVHGFDKGAFNDAAGEVTDRVLRGGFFGGPAHVIAEINDIYYKTLNDTLNSGQMGTEESIFTIMSYRHPELCNLINIDSNGLIITALEEIKNSVKVADATRLALYTLVFNIPEQFKMFAESLKSAYPKDYASCTKYAINNSTDRSTDEAYRALFKEHGFIEFLQSDNLGICGGRQVAAEHFASSDHEYMIFFEDDMLLHQPHNHEPCKNGFTTYQPDLFDKSIDIMESEDLDYLKLCFSEFYGDNHNNWAWYNVPQEKKEQFFPPLEDEPGMRSNFSTRITHTGTTRGLPYAIGEFHYCNWPIVFNKRGNQRMFLHDKYEHLYEQTWMSLAMNYMADGSLRAGCLLASPINHNRVIHYAANTRRENEHYTD